MLTIDLDELRAFLGYTSGDVSRDLTLELLADAAMASLRELMGRKFDYGIYRDTYQYRSWKHYVIETPIREVLEIQDGVSTISLDDYFIGMDSGLLQAKSYYNTGYPYHSEFMSSSGFFTVTYAGGYETLPGNLKLALFSAIQSVDSSQKLQIEHGGPVKRISVYDVGVTDFATGSAGASVTIRSALETMLAPQIQALTAIGTWLLHESEFVGGSPT